MARPTIMGVALQLQLMGARIGVLPVLAVGLSSLAAIGHFTVLPKVQAEIEANRQAQAAVRSAPMESEADHHLTHRHNEFRTRLAALEDQREHLKALFKEAANAGITLAQGDYRQRPEADCNCFALQVTLPIRGTYPQIRSFVDAILERLPALSLDEISFRRDNVKALAVDARLRLTLYLKDGA